VPRIERILVPLDHSPGGDAILDYACAVARGTNASITLLHVHDPPNEMIGMVPGATVEGETIAEHAAGVALLDRAVELLRGHGITPLDRIVERAASPSDAIVSHARRGAYDLVVMGTHGRKGLSRLVIGSVAEHVLRDAPCPVLTVHLPQP
jgi:nucleotide-binding universal stress UspA family protein